MGLWCQVSIKVLVQETRGFGIANVSQDVEGIEQSTPASDFIFMVLILAGHATKVGIS